MPSDEQRFQVVSRDRKGAILRIWVCMSESLAYQLAADLRKENWTHEYAVEPAPERGRVRGGISF